MSYVHLTTSERVKIETYLELGFSVRKIAGRLGRQPSTISRELKRNPYYDASHANQRYVERKKKCGARTKFTFEKGVRILEKLHETWSPEQIAGRLFQEEGLSFKTIYRWIYTDLVEANSRLLRQKGKRQKPRETRGRFNVGLPISKRPADVKGRQTFGHWELDTVVSGRGKSKACVATFVERKSRFYLAVPMEDRSAQSMESAIQVLHLYFPSGTFQTATTDRGKEFSCHERIRETLGVPMYFVDPYSSWQRGSNENANGLLREFFPKGTDFGKVSRSELAQALAWINGRPRKCLNWKTAYEVFSEEVLHLI
ncbi:IS30 family transposase [Exiguobacterium antarcticum]|uniref:IS30 family transposase n=1 Tax=Exiguobacterium antarcticum TaxID=132920 RepID=UPI000285EED8|nr:IS30 family transposase [Exiguobacterium antarcticum]AFS71174.1 Integrase catalytic region [Exiguobacterium antarcticum B7]